MTLQNTCLIYKFNKFHPPKFLLPDAANTVIDVKTVCLLLENQFCTSLICNR